MRHRLSVTINNRLMKIERWLITQGGGTQSSTMPGPLAPLDAQNHPDTFSGSAGIGNALAPGY